MNIDLSNKSALVCGSSQGIGKGIALALAELGASVTLFARNEETLKRVKGELNASKGQSHDILMADFSDPEGVEREIKQHLAQRGSFHILVNNTGGPASGQLLEAEPQDFLKAMKMHLFSSQLLVKAVVPGMKAAGYGRILQVISSSVKEPIPGLGVSNTTRGAMAAWGKTLAGELAPFGITVNNLLPGFIETERLYYVIRSRAEKAGVSVEEMAESLKKTVPMGRFGDPSEIAQVAAFLASPAASYVTGTNVMVDGGKTKTY